MCGTSAEIITARPEREGRRGLRRGDAVTGPEIGRDLAAGIPGARFLLVEEAGHLVNLEQPEIVNEALLDFLAPLWI